MQAAVYVPGSPFLDIRNDFPIPEPGPDEVIIKIKASGVCHTDVFLTSQFADDPREYILGHEACGIPVKFGSRVDRHKIKAGQLYAVQSLGGCVRCAHFAKPSGSVSVTSFTGFGLGANGGHAQFAAVDQKLLVPVPEGVRPEQAAVMADAGITVFHALHRVAHVKRGDKVIIFGIGGLGLNAVQIARHFGAEVWAVDIKPSSRKLAKEFGAVEAFDLEELDAQIAKGFTVDLAVDFVATNTSFTRAIGIVENNVIKSDFAKGGRILVVGVSDQNLPVNSAQIITTNISILTSVYGDRQDLIDVLELVAKGAIKPVIQTAPLKDANRVMDDLRANARKVLIPPGADDDSDLHFQIKQ